MVPLVSKFHFFAIVLISGSNELCFR